MSTDQTDDNRTPNGASDLLDDDIENISIDTPHGLDNISVETTENEKASPNVPAAAPPTPSTPVVGDQMFTKVEKFEHTQEEGYGTLVKTSIAAVSQIVDSIVQQKQAGNNDVSAIASREIDKYYNTEQQDNEGEAFISQTQDYLDGIHGEGVDAKEGEKAPYQDDKYGEQPPMSLGGGYATGKTNLDVSGDQLITSRKRREKPQKPKQDAAPPPNPFKDLRNDQSAPKTTNPYIEKASYGNAVANAHSFTDISKPGGQSPFSNNLDDSYDHVAMELGMTPESHPQFFRKKKYKLPVRILYNQYCQYCMIISGFVILSLSVAALVTRGFEEVKKHNSQVHPKWKEEATVSSSNGGQKEKLDWWLDDGGNGMTEKQFETLTYVLEDSYLPIWFDRKSGWSGQTYVEALEFCEKHDDFMPCPYDGE
jgi:hypothetical protein